MPIIFADTLSPSWDLVADVQILLHFHFMQNAYLAGTLVAITAGLMGFFMVLRNQSFAGHSLANVGFAGATGAVLFGIPRSWASFWQGCSQQLASRRSTLRHETPPERYRGWGCIYRFARPRLSLHSPGHSGVRSQRLQLLFGNVLGISDTDVGVIAYGRRSRFLQALSSRGPSLCLARSRCGSGKRGAGTRARLWLSCAVGAGGGGGRAGRGRPAHLCAAGDARCHRAVHHRRARAVAAALAVALALLFTWMGLAVGYFTPYPVGFFHHDLRLWHLCPRARRTLRA